MQALHRHFSKKTLTLLKELEEKIIYCDDLIFLGNEDKESINASISINPRFYEAFNDEDANNQIFILHDEDNRNLTEYLCNYYFKWRGHTDLVFNLMEEPVDLKRIREKLRQNNLPPSLIDNFKALHKAQEERTREAELIEEEETRRL